MCNHCLLKVEHSNQGHRHLLRFDVMDFGQNFTRLPQYMASSSIKKKFMLSFIATSNFMSE